MKKHFLTAFTALASAVLLTGCSVGVKNGTYVSVNGIKNMAEAYRSDPDTAFEQIFSEETEPDMSVTLKGDQFLIAQRLDSTTGIEWKGRYSANQAALRFSYADAVVNGTDETQWIQDRLTALNETGALPEQIAPRIYLSSAAYAYSKLPIGILRNSGVKESSAIELHKNFLCTPMYGMTVEGRYETGKDFAVNYVPADTLRNDKYSKAYYNEAEQTYSAQPDEEKLETELSILANRFGLQDSENMQFRITFSGGIWEMTAADGSSFTHGEYAESKKHPGFISVFEQPDDPQAKQMLDSLYPLFLFIDGGSGKIYYPGFVRKP
ncbi:MAG: hypothetical protein K5705_04850 [Oscillospiraceae bacterium]|nr:hypothetical protein [Oscillospiraceae bacterium]